MKTVSNTVIEPAMHLTASFGGWPCLYLLLIWHLPIKHRIMPTVYLHNTFLIDFLFLKFSFSSPMGNTQSLPKHNFYLTKVSNIDLPLVPFIHTIVGYNNTPVRDTDPLVLREILNTQDLCLDVLDILLNRIFKVTIPKFSGESEKLGINIIKLKNIPTLMKIQVTAVKESSSTTLRTGDHIIGIENSYAENEDELFYELKSNVKVRLVVLRGDKGYVVENEGTELGCGIGYGLLYSIPEREYFMSEYTGRIKRVVEEPNTGQGEASSLDTAVQSQEARVNNAEDVGQGSGSNDISGQMVDTNNNVLPEKDDIGSSQNTSFISQSVKDTIREAVVENKANLNTTISLSDASIIQDHLPAMKSVGSLCEEKEVPTNGAFDMHEMGRSIENVEKSLDEGKDSTKGNLEDDRSHPHIPERLSGDMAGRHTFNVVKNDKTASYVYRSPRDSTKSQGYLSVPINQANVSRIYDEAEVPTENQYFQGQHTKNDDEHANVVDTSVVCKENYTFKDGEMRMKDDVFEKKKHDESTKKNWQDMFEEDDESLPFDEKRKEVLGDIKDL